VGKRTLGSGKATGPSLPGRVARVTLNRSGRAMLRRNPRGFRATISATAKDAFGRRRTATKRVTLRRGSRPRR
jgi:hypothetical protein